MDDSNTMASTSMAAARGRGRGRPPKREHAQPPDAELQNYQEKSPGADSPNTIRRSSRKRFCKFDVRDVLSLRKPEHKIQIEGRIDSNLPEPAPPVAPAGAPSTAASTTTSPSIPPANRLFSMFPSNRTPPKLPPPPAALGIFVKPRSTPSLIVAQLNSESSSCNTSTATATAPATAAAAFAASVMRRGRGRPITKSSLDKTHSQSSSHSMNFSDSDTNSTGASTTGSIGSRGSTDSNEATAPRRKCRVTLKRLNFVQRQGSWDSGDSTVLGDAVVDVSSSSSSAASTPVLQDENALDEQPKMKPLLLPLPVSLPTVVDDDGDSSDSQIIFTEIDTGREVTGRSKVEQSEEPPQELEVETEQQEQEPDVCNVLTDVSSEEEDTSQGSSSARRRSRRTAKTEGANSSSSSQAGKTLEETFAEIAASSSKQILLKAESDSHSEGDNDEEEEEEHTLIDLIEDDSHDEGIHGEYELVLDEHMKDEGQVQVIELDGALAAAEEEQQMEPQLSTDVTLQLQAKSPRTSVQPDGQSQPQTIILEVEAEEEENASTEQQTPVDAVADVSAEPKPEPEAVAEDVVIIQIALPEPQPEAQPEISLEMEASQMIIQKLPLPLPLPQEEVDEKEVVPILVPMEMDSPIESMTEPTKAAESPSTGEPSPAAEPKPNEKETPSKPEQSAEEPKSHSNASLSLSPTAMAVATPLATPSAVHVKAIVECDAMFQALESANAQKMREETHKKKVKLEAKKAATSMASTLMPSNSSGGQKQTKTRTTTTTIPALGGRSKTRRNTSYYASNERDTTPTPVAVARSQAKKQKPSVTKKTEPRADGLVDPAANANSRKLNTDDLQEDFSSSSSSQQEEQYRGSATAKRSKSRGSLASDARRDEVKAHSQSAPKKESAMPTRRFTTIDRPSPKAAPRGTALGDLCKDGTTKATSTGGRQYPAISAAAKRPPTLSRPSSLESLSQKDAKKVEGKPTAGGKQSPANLIKNIRKSSSSGESLDATKKASSRTQSPASMEPIKRRQTTSSECLLASSVEAKTDERTPRPQSPKEKATAMPSITAEEPRLSFEQLLGQADTYTKTQNKRRTSTSAIGRSSPVSACSTSFSDSAVRAPEAGKAKEKAAPAPAERKPSPNAIRSRRFTTIDRTSWSDAPNGPRKTQSKPSTPRELSPNGDCAASSGSQPKSYSMQQSPAIGGGSKLTKKKINTSRLTLMDHSAADISEKLIKACLEGRAASSDEADAGKSQSPAPKQEAKQAAASVSCASRRSSRHSSISASSSSSSKPTSRMSSPAANEPKIKKISARRKTETPEQSPSVKKVDKLSSRGGAVATKHGSRSPLLLDQRRRITICAEPVLAAVALKSADPRVRNASPAELLPIPMPRERTLPKKSATLAAPTPKKPMTMTPKVAVKRASEPPDLRSKKPRRPTTSRKSTEEALPVQLDAVEPIDTDSTESASGKSKRWDVQPSTATEASAAAATATTPEVQKINTSRLTLMDHSAADISEKLIKACLEGRAANSDEADAGKSQSPAPKQEAKQAAASVSCASRRSSRHSSISASSSSSSKPTSRMSSPAANEPKIKKISARRKTETPEQFPSVNKVDKLSSRGGALSTKHGSRSPLLLDQRRRITICAEPVLAAEALRSADPRVRNASPAELLPIPMPRERTLPKKSATLAAPTPKKPKAPKVAVKAAAAAPATSPEVQPPEALRDIAKFIKDGVILLNRSYKDDEDEDEAQPEAVKGDDQLASASCLETPSTTRSPTPSGSSNSRSGASTRANTITEDSSPTLPLMMLPQGSNEDGSAGGVRRSHRIKQKPQGPKASQGRGVASSAPPFSMEDQMAELANTETINEQFLRSEGLLTFQQLRENYYRCARQVSQENAEMQCDCFLTGDEEAQGHLCCGAGCINRMLMIECGPLCTNGERCTNKRFQLHQCWPCRVFRTEKKGCGITAELLIPAGEFIMEYVGEVIDSEEFERRQHRYSKDRNRHYYFMALRGEAIIDATMRGNISRYINHSCDPNAETQKWTVNGELRIGFFSVKTILPGEEITFDYQYQRYGRDAQRCYCEAANCRGWIGTEPESDEGEQKNENNTQTDDTDSESDTEETEPEQSKSKTKASAAKNSSKSKVKLPAVSKEQRKKRESAAKAKERDREFKAGRWLKPTTGAGAGAGAAEKKDPRAAKPEVNKFHAMLEDPDVLEELSLLSRCGLKNQLDTLRISRIMVRAKLLPTRIQLLQVLTRGELPCRRLFLDYHGLRLLHAWISENGSEQELRMALLDALEALPIPNKTMLNESRVYQSVQQWSAGPAGRQSQMSSANCFGQRMLKLISKWSSLPEIFRIPKRERIEQMKEHEREADRTGERPTEKHVASHHVTAASALEDSARDSSTDRYRQDRFRRDTISSRNSGGPKPPMSRMSGNNTICTITTQPKGSNPSEGQPRTEMRRRPDNSSGATLETRRGGGGGGSGAGGALLSKELRRSLFERKVAQDEAEKRVCSEDWREHELRCEYFGADINTDPKLLPFSYNTETGEWFNSEDVPVMAPLRTDLALAPSTEMSEQDMLPAEYKLPASVDPLPLSWHWSRTIEGYIYYYNLRDRIPQWLPPSPEQRLQTLLEGDPQQHQPLQELDPALLEEELISVDPDYVGSLSSKSLAQHIETKVRERREIRHKKLCSVRVISPRRDEDRIYNQLESRKYKENKEKIRRRKEIYRRQRASADTVAATSSDASSTDAEAWSTPRYLYSSDEEVEAPKSPQLEGIIYGFNGSAGSLFSATKVDELEAELDMEPSTSAYALACLNKPQQIPTLVTGGSGGGINRKLPPLPPHTPEKPPAAVPERKSRGGGHERSKPKRKMLLHSTKGGRESIDKFRFDISGHVADFLRPFRKDNCQMGRITSDADYKFLIKRVSNGKICIPIPHRLPGHLSLCLFS
ncbi:blast:Probable histone-lysine N-methyltransferase CG1716 [Drosophila guanche]|uniref:[histone H3]-lysine(36) N-trimethyltransferase n=1 Tax=Drosophila guanche TaxID=7266 RepID=A0A3B0K3J0_DROGU|nr:blast:Probable histone-lysine N-methyltransferase CG1716 [Drosophila guanche]